MKFDITAALANIDREIAQKEAEIAEMKRGRKVLAESGDTLQSAFNLVRLYGRPAKSNGDDAAAPNSFAFSKDLDQGENIEGFVTAAPRPVRPADVHEAMVASGVFPEADARLIGIALAGLANAGRLKRVGHGLYWKPQASTNGAKTAKKLMKGAKLSRPEKRAALQDAIRAVMQGRRLKMPAIVAALEAHGVELAAENKNGAVRNAMKGMKVKTYGPQTHTREYELREG